MKKLNLLFALSVSIIASSSGMIQVGAANYIFNVDFSTKEVADFSDFKQTFSVDTYKLDSNIKFFWSGQYRMSSCSSPIYTLSPSWEVSYRLNGTGSYVGLGSESLPNFPCTTTNTIYLASRSVAMPSAVVSAIMNDDSDFVQFRSRVFIGTTFLAFNRTFYMVDYRNYFELEYDFNTTYLFNYFLSDQAWVSESRTAAGSSWTIGSTNTNYLQYVFTTAGDDAYYLNNSNTTTIGTTRKKYAVDYLQEFFRGENVGARFSRDFSGTDSYTITSSGGATIDQTYNWYFLNTANAAQAIVDAPSFDFEYDDCGSFLALNVGCFINNGLAYLTNDAPIISDAITLLNAAINLAAQTFGIIGNFADDNVFGYLILASFGFIAIRWLLKND